MTGKCNFYPKCVECNDGNPLCTTSYHQERVEKCLAYPIHLETPEQTDFRLGQIGQSPNHDFRKPITQS